jgi:hypothetical protein
MKHTEGTREPEGLCFSPSEKEDKATFSPTSMDTLRMPRPYIQVCCGPRCGAFPGHRIIFAAMERRSPLPTRPTLCQGFCEGGVTVVASNGTKHKIASVREAQSAPNTLFEDSK